MSIYNVYEVHRGAISLGGSHDTIESAIIGFDRLVRENRARFQDNPEEHRKCGVFLYDTVLRRTVISEWSPAR